MKNILLVEDDDIYRNRLARAFSIRGLQTFEAEDKQTFISLLESTHFDYAVIDLKVGSDSGLDILTILLKAQPECRAVVLTGYGTITTTVRAIKAGAVDYLTKPTDPDSILALLESGEAQAAKDETPVPTLEQHEWEHIQKVLTDCDGNVSMAAKLLGMHRRTLQRKLSKTPSQLS